MCAGRDPRLFGCVIVASGAWVARHRDRKVRTRRPGLEYLRQAALDEAWRESGAPCGRRWRQCCRGQRHDGDGAGRRAGHHGLPGVEDEMPAFDWELGRGRRGGVQLRTQWGPPGSGWKRARSWAWTWSVLQRFRPGRRFCPTLDESATRFIAADKSSWPSAAGRQTLVQDSIAGADADATADGAAGGVFVCGDAVSGPATVVEAIASGRRTAAQVHRLLTGAALPGPQPAARPSGCSCGTPRAPCHSLRGARKRHPPYPRRITRRPQHSSGDYRLGGQSAGLNCSFWPCRRPIWLLR